jgi:hypothetical protein
MVNSVPPRWRIALRLYTLDDLLRANQLAAIQKVAQQSVLIKVPSIAASVTALGTKGATLATEVTNVAQYERQLTAGIASRALARAAYDVELDTLKTLVENNSTNAGDVTSMGFPLLTVTRASKLPPDAPGALLVHIGRQHGKARVSAPGKGYQGKFAAEVAQSPTGPWSSLAGTGKSRQLSGYPSGTQLWVHFAAVRYGLQGPWGTAVLVTIP